MSMPWLLENWSTVASIGTLLSVGYMTARKFEKILGKDSKGRTIAERLDRVEYQLFPNGGSSMADKVNCLSDDQAEIKADVKQITGELKIVHDVLIAYISDKK
jgi:hypothetical protein